jgi:hypothetical protein
MEQTTVADAVQAEDIVVNKISLAQPWQWIEKGWRDMLAAGNTASPTAPLSCSSAP